jgi:hypothetical protein
MVASGVFSRISIVDGSTSPMTADDWTERLLGPQLAPGVPEPVRSLYAIAQGAMVYGSLYYQLYTLGLEQISRVAEAAVKAKVASLAPSSGKSRKRYVDLLAALRDQNVLTSAEHDAWTVFREYRNSATHLERVTTFDPASAARLLARFTAMINKLFL